MQDITKFIGLDVSKGTIAVAVTDVCRETPSYWGAWGGVVSFPSLISIQPGDRVKTNRHDAIQSAKLLRTGELTPVYVRSEEDEALRDFVRAREDAKEDLLKNPPPHQQVSSLP